MAETPLEALRNLRKAIEQLPVALAHVLAQERHQRLETRRQGESEEKKQKEQEEREERSAERRQLAQRQEESTGDELFYRTPRRFPRITEDEQIEAAARRRIESEQRAERFGEKIKEMRPPSISGGLRKAAMAMGGGPAQIFHQVERFKAIFEGLSEAWKGFQSLRGMQAGAAAVPAMLARQQRPLSGVPQPRVPATEPLQQARSATAGDLQRSMQEQEQKRQEAWQRRARVPIQPRPQPRSPIALPGQPAPPTPAFREIPRPTPEQLGEPIGPRILTPGEAPGQRFRFPTQPRPPEAPPPAAIPVPRPTPPPAMPQHQALPVPAQMPQSDEELVKHFQGMHATSDQLFRKMREMRGENWARAHHQEVLGGSVNRMNRFMAEKIRGESQPDEGKLYSEFHELMQRRERHLQGEKIRYNPTDEERRSYLEGRLGLGRQNLAAGRMGSPLPSVNAPGHEQAAATRKLEEAAQKLADAAEKLAQSAQGDETEGVENDQPHERFAGGWQGTQHVTSGQGAEAKSPNHKAGSTSQSVTDLMKTGVEMAEMLGALL